MNSLKLMHPFPSWSISFIISWKLTKSDAMSSLIFGTFCFHRLPLLGNPRFFIPQYTIFSFSLPNFLQKFAHTIHFIPSHIFRLKSLNMNLFPFKCPVGILVLLYAMESSTRKNIFVLETYLANAQV